MKQVTIFTIDYCSYCARAKRLLAQKAVDFEEIDATARPDLREDLVARTGQITVPQIWIGDIHVGGSDDLYALEHSGELDRLLHE